MNKRNCRECGKEFDATHTPNQRYCTPACRTRYHHANQPPTPPKWKACFGCGMQFEAIASRRYCSGCQSKRTKPPLAKVRPCAECQQVFTAECGTQKYCSLQCRNRAKNRRAGKMGTPRTCRTCGTGIERPIANQQYCGAACKPVHVVSRKVPEERPCARCGDSFRPTPPGRIYCSTECRTGGSRPRYEIRPDYVYATESHWRAQLLKIAGNRCADCGATEDLHAHHIIPKAQGGKNTIRNGIVVCKGCHDARHFPVDGDLVDRIAHRVVELLEAKQPQES